jgi:mRNA-degrading endonuclease RelE of RelBE toxin-antitoxin system
MDKTQKLLNKMSPKQRDELLEIVDALGEKNTRDLLRPIKLKGTDLYRVRDRRFRIIFHIAHGEAVVDSIRMRNEKTYKL